MFDRYDVSFYGSNKEEIHRNITGDKWEEAGPAPCSEYDVMIVSVIHNTKYSEEVDPLVLTPCPPDSGAGANLISEITASQHGLEAKWEATVHGLRVEDPASPILPGHPGEGGQPQDPLPRHGRCCQSAW